MTSPNTQVNSKIQRVRLAHEANSRTCVSAAPRLAVLQELVALLVLSLLPCPRKTPSARQAAGLGSACRGRTCTFTPRSTCGCPLCCRITSTGSSSCLRCTDGMCVPGTAIFCYIRHGSERRSLLPIKKVYSFSVDCLIMSNQLGLPTVEPTSDYSQ